MEEEKFEDQIFKMYGSQVKKFKEWKKDKGEIYVGAIGGAYTICFTPTGLGDIVIVKCADGTQIDLTEYDLW